MKLLVISLAGIGDTLIATPLIHELCCQFPDATIDAFVLWPGAKDLLEGNPHLHVVHQQNLIKEGVWKSWPLLCQLRRERYDISINVHTLGRIHYRLVARFIGAGLRLSHAYENHGWIDRLLVNRTLPQDYTVHSVENNQRLLSLLGRTPILDQPGFEIHLQLADKRWAQDYLEAHQLAGRRRVGLHVGSGGTKNLRLKRWPLDHWIELVRRLVAAQPEAAFLLFGGPEEQEDHARLLAAAPPGALFAPISSNLREAAALIGCCDLFLSVDTALMHVAAALKVPGQIVIEAPTLNPTNVPWQTRYQVVRNPVINGRNLEYYRYDGRPIRGSDEELLRCMASISVDRVYHAVMESWP